MKSLLSKAGYGLNPKTNVWSRPDYLGIDYDDGEVIEQRLAEIIEHASDISVYRATPALHGLAVSVSPQQHPS